MKTCLDCQTELPLAHHNRLRCRDCADRSTAARRRLPHRLAARKACDILRQYSMTMEEWDRRFAEQNGLCRICRKRPATDVDHNHTTGAVRGLLCPQCNKGIGLLGDDPDTALSASEYLRKT